jgi:hypothetical protein
VLDQKWVAMILVPAAVVRSIRTAAEH